MTHEEAVWSVDLVSQQELVLDMSGYVPHHRWPAAEHEVSPETLESAVTCCATLVDTLVHLARRKDERPATTEERARRNVPEQEKVTRVRDEPLAFALKWVHDHVEWQTPRCGAELWDYVRALAADGVTNEAKDAVLPVLRTIDNADTRRQLWSELLSRFPQVGDDLSAEPRPEFASSVSDFERPVQVAEAAKVINKRSDLILNKLRRAGCRTSPKHTKPAYAEHDDLCKLFERYRKHCS